MDNITVDDINVNVDDPEGGSIVQADDPQMFAAAAFDGSSGSSGNNSWYWSSMLKLMEQGAAANSMNGTHSISNNLYTSPGQQPAAEHTPPPSTSSPSSSSVHDQPIEMLPQNNVSDPDSSVWGQEFLSGPIGEHKGQLACSEDGLHELLYPRTVLELLFSDQLKLEQMPSWPDILQHTLAGGPGKNSFGQSAQFVPSDKNMMAGAGQDNIVNMNMDTSPLQLDVKFPHYVHQLAAAGVDDRLSSSTASSTLSDNAMDIPWSAPGSEAAAQCEHGAAAAMQAHRPAVAPMQHSSPPLISCTNNMQQNNIDLPVRVKQEYDLHVPSSSLLSSIITSDSMSHYPSNNYLHQQHLQQSQRVIVRNAAGSAGFDHEAMINMNPEYEQKPNVLNKLWNTAVINQANDPLSHINHKHHIYESITAANFSHNLRQVAGLSGNGYFGVPDPHARNIIPSTATGAISSNLQDYASQQMAKKSRSFHEGGVASCTMGQLQATTEPKKELTRMESLADAKSNIIIGGGDNIEGAHNLQLARTHTNLKQQQQQISGPTGEYNNFKRSRIEQQQQVSGPPTTTPLSSCTTTTNSSSSASLKSQPVRKEKLSERITTLQQLVSPFGKTDTASVLLEAIGYIKFLQDQVQALSAPYFKSTSSNQNGDRNYIGDIEGKPDLRSRGLCLVPLSCTMQVANDNGADYWFGGAFR